MEEFIHSFGAAGPLVFIGIQVLQVIFAPVPGEATGFIGGYLFGAYHGFVYSSIGLTLGSLINFGIGRFLGRNVVRKIIPPKQMNRLDGLVRPRGVTAVFFLFLFPGFPKDYLCLFLGITDLNLRLFFFLAAFGRMPGTLALSIQGSSLLERNYLLFFGMLAVIAAAAMATYRYREQIFRWLNRL